MTSPYLLAEANPVAALCVLALVVVTVYVLLMMAAYKESNRDEDQDDLEDL